tara:strand:- start:172 stop:3231 length:3060 start_codon:yes stop_codon:yes gene_type:complete
MSESITNLDINFSNGGGAHTATVRSIVSAKSPDGTPSLGFVEGDMGEGSAFSEGDLNDLMKNFMLVEKTTSSDPTKKTIQRKYTDETSMKLNSYVVLVRGINAPVPQRLPLPDSDEAEVMVSEPWSANKYEGAVPYFSEVYSDPPLTPPYGPSPPTIHNSVIIAGQVYNFEAAAQFNGMKMSLVYQNNELKENLSLNEETVSDDYLEAPDLAQYNLKFGYTFDEFKQMLKMAEVPFDEETFNVVDGADNILFEISGSLGSVLSSIASYFGYYHYIDPFDNKVKFISSAVAAGLPVENPNTTTDQRIVNASFTESAITENLVNSYVGSTEKKEPNSPEEDEPKMRSSFFKRVMIERIGERRDPITGEILFNQESHFAKMNITYRELGAFFGLFNQEETRLFDKFTFILMMLSAKAARVIRHNLRQVRLWPPDLQNLYDQKGVDALDPPLGPVYLRGDVIGGDDDRDKDIVRNPLYLPVPRNPDREVEEQKDEKGNVIATVREGGWDWIAHYGWGPEPKERAHQSEWIFLGGEVAAEQGETAAEKNDQGHKIKRTLQVDKLDDDDNVIGKRTINNSAYFSLWYKKSVGQLNFENTDENGIVDFKKVADLQINPPKRSMPMPSESKLFTFLELYYKLAGGLYVSNGYTKYRAERTTYENMNNITVTGPYKGDTLISEIDDLSTLNNFLTTMGVDTTRPTETEITSGDVTYQGITVRHLADHTGGDMGEEYAAVVVGDDGNIDGDDLYFFIAQKTWPKLEKNNTGDPNPARIDFERLDTEIEFFEPPAVSHVSGQGLFVGGNLIDAADADSYEARPNAGDLTWFLDLVRKSHKQFMYASYYGYPQRSLKLPYTRSKTRINKSNEAGEEAEDNALASGSEAGQKLAEIYDRYDLKSWEVMAPEHSLLSKPTLTSASGTTTEMRALKAARGEGHESEEYKLKTSSKTFYGLVVPRDEEGKVNFSAITSSFSFSMGEGGIQTTVGESTVKIIPPDQTYLIDRGMETIANKTISSRLNARQKNYLGL